MATKTLKLTVELDLKLTDGNECSIDDIKQIVDEELDGTTFYVNDPEDGEESSYEITGLVVREGV